MRFYFTKNNLIGSKAIRWGLDEDCSHFAFGSDNPYTILESRLETGFGKSNYESFHNRNSVVHCLEVHATPDQGRALYDRIVSNCAGKAYDQNGVLWWTWVAFTRKVFGRPKPTVNQWQDKHKFYCVEILIGVEDLLKEMLGVDVILSMMTPHDLFLKLKESPNVKEVVSSY